MTKIVLVCTSAGELKGHLTGLWLEELAAPYYLFQEAGYDIVVASPAGGAVPIDKKSIIGGFFTDPSKRFLHDADAVGRLSHSIKLDTIDFSSVDVIYMTGGHGPCADYVDNPTLKNAIEFMYTAGKIVAADCHGPVCLVQCVKADGTPLVQGLTVTGFSDSEEDAVQFANVVPFLLEARLKELGANYEKAEDWHPKVCVDGNLVTGQNPGSSEECAKAVIQLLSEA